MSKLLRYLVGGAPLMIYDHLNSSKEVKEISSSAISEDEVKHINQLIDNAKLRGTKELTINISSELHDEISLGGTILEPSGVNPEMKLTSDTSGSGKCQLHIIFPTPDEGLEKLEQLNKLYEAGALNEEEYSNAKARVIQTL
jgi:hypothetical protein